MFDLISMCVEDVLVMLSTVILFVWLLGRVYPRLTLRKLFKGAVADRGARRMVFPEGRAVVYEPALEMRRFVPCYALIKQDGCVYIKCRVHRRVAFLRYDVSAFDGRGRLLDVVSVRERITEEGATHAVRLPSGTAYVSLTLRKVDRVYTGRNVILGYSPVGIAVYVVLAALTAAAAAWILRSNLAEILSTFRVRIPLSGVKGTLLGAAAVGVGCAAWIVSRYHKLAGKVLNR
ncbi:MAG: hypothetical protein E7610_09870 [Ruminococcaceae bacterium]|nr:hypothetical protein [Oscillospiraceae bacterium]